MFNIDKDRLQASAYQGCGTSRFSKKIDRKGYYAGCTVGRPHHGLTDG
jgi:hypothetical protein